MFHVKHCNPLPVSFSRAMPVVQKELLARGAAEESAAKLRLRLTVQEGSGSGSSGNSGAGSGTITT